MKEAGRRLALFISSGTQDMTIAEIANAARPLEKWAEDHADYTRISEYVEIDFGLRPSDRYVPEQIDALLEKKEELQKELESKLETIDALIGTLGALEHKPSE